MSETEIHTGKMRVFERNANEVLGDYFKRFLESKGIEYSKADFDKCFVLDDPDDTRENLRDFIRRFEGAWRKRDFVVTYENDLIFDFVEHAYHEDMDIRTLTKNDDGTYDFVMSFYNGETCLEEMLGDAFARIKS
jgi:hypothetical protein